MDSRMSYIDGKVANYSGMPRSGIVRPIPFGDNGRLLPAGMAESVDAADSKSAALKSVGVRVPLPAPEKTRVSHFLPSGPTSTISPQLLQFSFLGPNRLDRLALPFPGVVLGHVPRRVPQQLLRAVQVFQIGRRLGAQVAIFAANPPDLEAHNPRQVG